METNTNRLRQNIFGIVGEAARRSPLPSWKIEVGSYYELHHSKLTAEVPAVLRSIRVVRVTSRTELKVTVSYPSDKSIDALFGNFKCAALRSRLYPLVLDEDFDLVPDLAYEVLGREVPSHEFAKCKNTRTFWLMEEIEEHLSPVSVFDTAADSKEDKNGTLLLDLQNHELMGWGSQRHVTYLREPVAHHKALRECASQEGIRNVKKEEETKEIKVKKIIPYTRKRKRGAPVANHTQKIKLKLNLKQKPVEENWNKEYIDRWRTKRYEAAAKDLCDILKGKNAVYGNPISRFELRALARRKVGDTGLLDHLLKHLAGKVVPGEDQRLRRRCDAEGKMEYWLESADLVQVRKEAGVQDPYWTPPPGWKSGDCVAATGCLCGKEVKLLKEELGSMRRQIEELKSKDEDERAVVLVQPDSSASSERLISVALKLSGSKKEKYEALLKKKSMMEEHLHEISKVLLGIEEDVKMLSYQAEEPASNSINSLALVKPKSSSCKGGLPDTGEVSESDNEEDEDEEEDDEDEEEEDVEEMRPRKLKPCDHKGNFSNLHSQTVNNLVQELMDLTASSTSPHSTTTSLTTH